MFSTTDCDLRYSAHTERVTGIDRTGWQQTTSVAAPSSLASVGALMARISRLARPTRRAERVATSHAGRGLASTASQTPS
jgi:hypothetical protein